MINIDIKLGTVNRCANVCYVTAVGGMYAEYVVLAGIKPCAAFVPAGFANLSKSLTLIQIVVIVVHGQVMEATVSVMVFSGVLQKR